MIAPELVALVAALGAGAFGALVGVGGGIVIVPLLTILLGVEVHTAIGASLLGVIAVSTTASASFLTAGFANRQLGLTLLGATAIGGIVGGYVAGFLDGRIISGLFGVVLIGVAVQMLRARSRPPAEVTGVPRLGEIDASYLEPTSGELIYYRAERVPLASVVSLFAGALSGLLGIGGGVVNVPTMNVLMGVPIRVATATSTYMLGATAVASAVLYFSRGQIDASIAAPVVVGVFIGARGAARLSRRVPRTALVLLFVVVAAFLSVQMLLKAVGTP